MRARLQNCWLPFARESVDQALCYGWMDGVRWRVDDDIYTIRFTPRQGSIWSAVNVDKVAGLSARGLTTPAGEDASGDAPTDAPACMHKSA